MAVLQGRSWERAEGAAAEVDTQAMLQKVRCTVIQETPFGTAGDMCFCFVSGLSDQALHPQPIYSAEQRVEQTRLIPRIEEIYLNM